jgi:hypothetical protein
VDSVARIAEEWVAAIRKAFANPLGSSPKPHIFKKPDDLLGRWLVQTPTYTAICYGIRHAMASAKSLAERGLDAQIYDARA